MSAILTAASLILAFIILIAESLICSFRGYKISLIRLAENVGAGVIAFFAAYPLSGVVSDFIASFYNKGSSFETEMYLLLSDNNIRETAADEISGLFSDVSNGIIAALVFVLLFWVIKFVFYIANKIVFSVLSREKEKEKPKTFEKLIGLGIGAVCGLIYGALTFMPISGIANLLSPIYVAGLSETLPSEANEAIGTVISLPTNAVYRYTGAGLVFEPLWQSYTNVKTNGSDNVLADVISIIADNSDEISSIAAAIKNNRTDVSELTGIIVGTSGLIKDISEAGILSEESEKSLIDTAMEYVENASGLQLRYKSSEDFLGDVAILGDLTTMISEKGFIELIFKSDITAEDVDTSMFDEESVSYFVDKLYELSIYEEVVPYISEKLLTIIGTSIGAEVVPAKLIDVSGMSSELKLLLLTIPEMIEVLKSNGNLTEPGVVEKFTKSMETIKESPFVDKETYINLLSAMRKGIAK